MTTERGHNDDRPFPMARDLKAEISKVVRRLTTNLEQVATAFIATFVIALVGKEARFPRNVDSCSHYVRAT